MDTETKEKLTELQHQHDLLRTKTEASVRTMKADNEATFAKNESAIDRLRTDIERLHTAIEGNARVLLVQMVIVVGAGVAILAFILK